MVDATIVKVSPWAGRTRYGLDGTPNGEVTVEQRLHARAVLRRMQGRKRSPRHG